jgi:hypothetical protein
MGAICNISTGKMHLLEPEHIVGRAPTCTLRLRDHSVSAQHALLRWKGLFWTVKDLGSSNGTFLNGSILKSGEERTIRLGSKVGFGALEVEWELVDEAAPRVMVVPIDGGEPVLMEGELLAIPSTEDPCATIYRGDAGRWLLEQPESIAPIANAHVFQSAGRSWKFCCPEDVYPTVRVAAPPKEMLVRCLQLTFEVSRDEEYVRLHVNYEGKTFDMGARARNYLLLTLARRRLADAQRGLADSACGWVHTEELSHDPTMAPPQLNVDVFRFREHFARLGVVDAANVVERRPATRELRVGTGQIVIGIL